MTIKSTDAEKFLEFGPRFDFGCKHFCVLSVSLFHFEFFPKFFEQAPQGPAKDKLDLFVTEHNKLHLESRLKYLEQQAVSDLTLAVSKYENPVFTTALIAGDDVILHILHKVPCNSYVQEKANVFQTKSGLLPKVKVEKFYGFKAVVYKAEGCQTREDFDEKRAGRQLSCCRVAKVEPLLRALRESQTKLWINGRRQRRRRRDQGFERAALQVWEREKMNPIAFWTFEDCWKYIEKEKVPYHPLHDDGYPSLGDDLPSREMLSGGKGN
eukprot:760121-Hanusia_phi.AAC.5